MIFETVLGVLASIALGIFIVNIIVLDAHISNMAKGLDEVRKRLEYHVTHHNVSRDWDYMALDSVFQKIDELRERIEEIEHERRENHNTTGIS